jgi:hypothetical protein
MVDSLANIKMFTSSDEEEVPNTKDVPVSAVAK